MLTDDEKAARLAHLEKLIAAMAEAVRVDGGDLELVSADVDAGVVHVRLSGACSSCAISSVTMEGGVRRILTERLEWVTEIHGDVDEPSTWVEGSGAWEPKRDGFA